MMEIVPKFVCSNICDRCLNALGQDEPNIYFREAGACHRCGMVGSVYDHDLIALYTALEIEPEAVWLNLYRLRDYRASAEEQPKPGDIKPMAEILDRILKHHPSCRLTRPEIRG